MAGRFIDLHTHSNASDGSDRPAALVRKAAELGLAALALTDHDSLEGLDEAEAEAARVGIAFIRGIEMAVQDDFGELHVVGLWMPRPSARMSETLVQLRRNRRARNQAMLDALSAHGMPMTLEEVRNLSGGGALGRPHIAMALRNRGYVASRREAFEQYIGWGGKAFVPRVLPAPREAIGLLRDEGAIVALAHPCLSPTMNEERLNDILAEFRACGLTALEAYHSVHDNARTRLCVELAARHNLLLTGGSDYHGENKEGIALGRGRGGLRVPYMLLEKMREWRKSKGLWV